MSLPSYGQWHGSPGDDLFPMPVIAIREIPVWQIIRIGTHLSFDALVEAVRKRGFDLQPEVLAGIPKSCLVVAKKVQVIKLFCLSPQDLNLPINVNTTLREFYAAIERQRLQRCTFEVALQLLCQFPETLLDQILTIGTDPIIIATHVNALFVVQKIRGHWSLGMSTNSGLNNRLQVGQKVIVME
jgi:hypothetical protein